jgi:hypothetical protein
VAQLLIEDSTCAWTISDEGVSGYSIYQIASIIDGVISPYRYYQHYALINLGVNGMPTQEETATKTYYQYIIDALHTKWPAIKIYLTKPWMRGYDTESTTLAGWIDDLIAANPGVCFVADDESIWLKGADNGATMTVDGVHYSVAGEAEKTNQMVTVLGY